MTDNQNISLSEIYTYLSDAERLPFTALTWQDGREPAINAVNLNRYETILNQLINNKGEPDTDGKAVGFLKWALELMCTKIDNNDQSIGDPDTLANSNGLQHLNQTDKPFNGLTNLGAVVKKLYELLQLEREDEIKRLSNIHLSDLSYDEKIIVLNCGTASDAYVLDDYNQDTTIYHDGNSKLPEPGSLSS